MVGIRAPLQEGPKSTPAGIPGVRSVRDAGGRATVRRPAREMTEQEEILAVCDMAHMLPSRQVPIIQPSQREASYGADTQTSMEGKLNYGSVA
jgi:hypothetical protein